MFFNVCFFTYPPAFCQRWSFYSLPSFFILLHGLVFSFCGSIYPRSWDLRVGLVHTTKWKKRNYDKKNYDKKNWTMIENLQKYLREISDRWDSLDHLGRLEVVLDNRVDRTFTGQFEASGLRLVKRANKTGCAVQCFSCFSIFSCVFSLGKKNHGILTTCGWSSCRSCFWGQHAGWGHEHTGEWSGNGLDMFRMLLMVWCMVCGCNGDWVWNGLGLEWCGVGMPLCGFVRSTVYESSESFWLILNHRS